MKKRTKKRAPVAEREISLGSIDVCLPEECEISDGMNNEAEIAKWWRIVRTVTKAIHSLDRRVLLQYDPQEGRWYLSSVPEALSGAGRRG